MLLRKKKIYFPIIFSTSYFGGGQNSKVSSYLGIYEEYVVRIRKNFDMPLIYLNSLNEPSH